MKVNTLGEILKYYRQKYELQQEKVCSGICSIATLSRVEKGNRIIDSLMAESLLGRIGNQVLEFELLLNDIDYALWHLRQEIASEMRQNHFTVVKEMLDRYKKMMPDESVHEQFFLYNVAMVKLAENETEKEVCELLYQALKLTKPELDSESGEGILYNPLEIEIIVLLIRFNYEAWRNRDKEKELQKLFAFVEKIYKGSQKEDTSIKILIELVNLEWKIEDYRCVIKYVDEAVEYISQGRGIDYIADLHFLKAKAIEQQYHKSEEWSIEEKKCREECLMAYYVFEILKQEKELQDLREFCEVKLEWQIIG